MLVLVINLGNNTSKFKFFDMAGGESELAAARYPNIALPGSPHTSYTAVANDILQQIEQTPDAVGFIIPHGGPFVHPTPVTDELIGTLQQCAGGVSNQPGWIELIQAVRPKLPNVPQLAVFDMAFHHTIPLSRQVYAIPQKWSESLRIRRYGAHGMAHQYVATRIKELLPEARRVINCFLDDEASSVCALENGRSLANSSGMGPFSGLPQSRAVGDFDASAIPPLLKHGLSMDEIDRILRTEAGLLALSGFSDDILTIERAAVQGNPRATLAIDAFTESVRHDLGAYLLALGGCDVLAFSGSIAETSTTLRAAICRGLGWIGIELDPNKNETRGLETKISSVESNTEIWIIPADAQLMAARHIALAIIEPYN